MNEPLKLQLLCHGIKKIFAVESYFHLESVLKTFASFYLHFRYTFGVFVIEMTVDEHSLQFNPF